MRAAVVTLAVTLFGVFASEAAAARKGGGSGGHKHHGVVGVGVAIGWPYWGYPPPYYYYPAYYPVSPQPPTYVEQDPAPASEPEAWWYYCESETGYYPQVTKCPSGWQRVAPVAPPPQ